VKKIEPRTLLALDIGGVNLKAAHSKGGIWSRAFGLTRCPDGLLQELYKLVQPIPGYDSVVLTMTAELCDCFATKRQGVAEVLGVVEALADGRPIGVWSTDGRFVDPAGARAQPLRCASANWHALATFVATQFQQGTTLLIDTGSTTTDILWLDAGHIQATGLTDLQRLAAGELVYIGAARTPVSALGPSIEWDGKRWPVMAEPFATTGDIYLLMGQLAQDLKCTDTADGRPSTVNNAAARLARMIGADLEMVSVDQMVQFAHAVAKRVSQRLTCAISQVLNGRKPNRVVISGSGDFIVTPAVDGALPSTKVIRFADLFGNDPSVAACAYALAHLPCTTL